MKLSTGIVTKCNKKGRVTVVSSPYSEDFKPYCTSLSENKNNNTNN
ncbi:hypothetical protein M1M24_gp42 [Polaribacter phage Freya_1]|uniref:Uncharacterized protein n=1 Tax=Polaribacter phage Freya_1 TaxID=2745662 RepID=A0A8E4ZCP1_9CAUD|nr:hypothetical protein M1M24_gp42 [Polaribacter phage Freya_1]QQV90979.1 hypothetical protein Freya2_42 [Polaribacter phage Freya_2]QQV91047.1 hypothetical protein Freya3_42 [Polaribacter phage Freya_3]QQV91115.1 hypothetical protein Freya4_42 [Polaribacter phage Freya_4]QQV91190.1 hypothetical protein Freya8_49 [Polaribacter phage Freya_8]QQV91267.1 hypothetical protein Freya9_51 [Polaribacter phage Freya_9]QQV91345.1 hypothetical protein Freya10_52 [Polaribacter phage Freya_10]QYV99924.1 